MAWSTQSPTGCLARATHLAHSVQLGEFRKVTTANGHLASSLTAALVTL